MGKSKLTIFAWIGSFCFAISAIPAAWEAFQAGICHYSWPFLWLWLIGEINLVIYMIAKKEWVIAGLNYGINLLCLVVLFYFNASP
jgi:hypothetical protein